MKTLLLTTTGLLFASPPDGDREKGLEAYRAGRYAEAQAAFARAAAEAPESAELQWNLALAAWRAGDLATAEVAAEKYAALDPDAKVDLHRGLLGAVRYAEAEAFEAEALEAERAAAGAPPPADGEPADPLPLQERPLRTALQAQEHFVGGARANQTQQLLRNTERALRKVDALKQRIEELLRERQQQPQRPEQPGEEQQDGQEPQPEGEQPESQQVQQPDARPEPRQ